MFENGKCTALKGQKYVLLVHLVNQLYTVKSLQYHKLPKQFAFILNMQLWHARLVLVNSNKIVYMVRRGVVHSSFYFKGDQLVKCVSCITGNACQTNVSTGRTTPLIREKLMLVHFDECDPTKWESFKGANYFAIFNDDCSRCSEGCSIKINPTYYLALAIFASILRQKLVVKSGHFNPKGVVIISRMCLHSTLANMVLRNVSRQAHFQNGVAKRMNRTLLKRVQ